LNEGATSTNNVTIQVPVLVNTKALSDGDELVVLKDVAGHAEDAQVEVPAAKKPRTSKGNGKGCGKK
jgi:hypothetical protein